MAITSGFFNSISHDRRYGLEDMSRLFDGIITDGVYAHIGDVFAVSPGSGTGEVNVGTGRAWFFGTWTHNDAPVVLQLSEASTYGPRYDAICIEINKDIRANSLIIVTGAPATNPVHPNINPVSLGSNIHRKALAYIRRPKNDGSNGYAVSASDIKTAVGTAETPFVTGVLESISVTALLDKWEAAAAAKIDGLDAAVQDIFNGAVPAGYLSKKFTTTAAYRGWTAAKDGDVDAQKITISVAGLLATDTPVIDVDLSSATGEAARTILDGWGYVYRAVTENGVLTLWATDKPDQVDIPLQLQAVRK